MRQLTDEYWNKFTKIRTDGAITRDGLQFEDLVECLLKIEYGKEWKRTPKSHDNNRDFHLTTPEYTLWAECKNYAKTIALDTIAPTLVLAQIFDVNKLLFFSYSDINFSAQKKIYSFGTKTKKEIEIYAGATLDKLIIKNKRHLPVKFRPQKKHIIPEENMQDLEWQFFFIQNPILGATLDDRDIINIPDVQKISYNTVFEIGFICVNHSLECDYQVELSLYNVPNNDNRYFTPVDYEISEEDPCFSLLDIPSAGGILKRYFFKSNRFKANLNLPVFQAQVLKNGTIQKTVYSPLHTVNNLWIGKTILIGEQYRTIIKTMEQYALNNDEVSCFTVYGTSGTGKTRLLKEMQDVLLRHKYRIISFIGNEEDSAYTILKELIYFIYEVPRDEILKGLEQDAFMQEHIEMKTPASQAYLLARRFSKAHSDSDLIEIIDESFDIVYEKISKERIAIMIDNIQFFGNAMIHFLQKYIIYSKHQARYNTSVLILSINQDYITDKTTEFLNFLQDISKDKSQISCHEVAGFHNMNQGILFLRELLHTSDDSLDQEFEIILKKTTLRPYYIYQAIYYLYEKEAILEVDDGKGFFPYLERFHDTVDTMPPRIKEIISNRWDTFLKRYNLNEEETVCIMAAIYLFRELSPQVVQLLHFPFGILKLLEQRMFIKQNENGNWIFDHDIIENFFTRNYINLDFLIISRIKQNRIFRGLSEYPFVQSYYRLCSKRLSYDALKKIYKETTDLSISSKLAFLYYSKLLNAVLKGFKANDDIEKWMRMLFGTCNLAKNIVGIKKADEYFITANKFLDKSMSIDILMTNAFRNYVNIYTDSLFFQKRHDDAICYLEKILQYPMPKNTDQSYALQTMIYNRLLIHHRELPSEYHKTQASIVLSKAQHYASMLENPSLHDEFTYLNLSDEGYNHYCLYEEKEILLSIWNHCLEYPPERLPQKAMNYFRKSAQINLINQNYAEVFKVIDAGNNYMNVHHISNTEKLNFSLSFSIYKIMALLQENPVENRTVLTTEITHAIDLSKLMSQRYLYELLSLKAIICSYNKDKIGSYYHHRESYSIFCKKPSALRYQEKKAQLLSNIYVSFQMHDMLNEAEKFLSDADYKLFHQLDIQIPGYEAKGVQRTSDKLFNLPCV